MKTKKCVRCNNEFPASLEYFSKRYGRKNNELLSYCRKCFSAIQNERHLETKKRLLEYKGRKCVICGYDKGNWNLTFHHLDSSKKEMTIAATNRNFESLKKEVDKCIVACRNCHGDIHQGLYPEYIHNKIE